MSTLIKSGASATAPPPTPRDYAAEANVVRAVIRNTFPSEALPTTADSPSGPFTLTVDFISSLLGDLIHDGKFSNSEVWNKCAGTYLDPWLRGIDKTGASLAEKLRLHFLEIDLVRLADAIGIIVCPDNRIGQEGQTCRHRRIRGRTAVRHRLLFGIWRTPPVIPHQTTPYPWPPLRHTWREWFRKVDPHAAASR